MRNSRNFGQLADKGEGARQDGDLVDTKTAAKILGLRNHHTLEVWRSSDRYPTLRYHRVGSAIRYRIADLRAFLDASAVGGSGPLSAEEDFERSRRRG